MTQTLPAQHAPRTRSLALLGVAVGVFVLWLIPLTAVVFDLLDDVVFHALNGSLEWGQGWRAVWAAANHRVFDAAVAGVYAAVFTFYCFHRTERETAARRFGELVALVALLVVARALLGLVLDMIDYRRASPTRVFDSAIYLSEYFEGWKIKDSSGNSYPGDHGFVSIFCVLYFVARAPRRYAVLMVLVASVALLPRLVGGAHWITDIIAGSFVFAVVAWVAAELSGAFDKVASWMTRLLARPVGWVDGQFARLGAYFPARKTDDG